MSFQLMNFSGRCTGLDPSWEDMSTNASFPVETGVKISLKCQKSGAINVGDNEVVCYAGTFFLFNRQPLCLEPG